MATSRTGTGRYKRWRREVLGEARASGITNCPRCGVWLDYDKGLRPNSAEPDHITPHAAGGTETPENGAVLCRRCNQSLGDKKPRTRRKQVVTSIDFTTE